MLLAGRTRRRTRRLEVAAPMVPCMVVTGEPVRGGLVYMMGVVRRVDLKMT